MVGYKDFIKIGSEKLLNICEIKLINDKTQSMAS